MYKIRKLLSALTLIYCVLFLVVYTSINNEISAKAAESKTKLLHTENSDYELSIEIPPDWKEVLMFDINKQRVSDRFAYTPENQSYASWEDLITSNYSPT
jgi:hypothetical protein